MTMHEKRSYCAQHMQENLEHNAMKVLKETNPTAMNAEVNSEYRILSTMLRERIRRSG